MFHYLSIAESMESGVSRSIYLGVNGVGCTVELKVTFHLDIPASRLMSRVLQGANSSLGCRSEAEAVIHYLHLTVGRSVISSAGDSWLREFLESEPMRRHAAFAPSGLVAHICQAPNLGCGSPRENT